MLVAWVWMSWLVLQVPTELGPERWLALAPPETGPQAAEDGTPQPPPKP